MWACLDSNQGPLPYQRQERVLGMFTVVKKYLQTKLFSCRSRHACSPLLERVVVNLSSGHPVYGNSALLYIGMAVAQEFGKRIPQEQKWLNNRDAGRVEVYVGRLIG
jgi:hypothetical protein